MTTMLSKIYEPLEEGVIKFEAGGIELIRLCPNGDIFVKGKLAENDKQVVDAMREYLCIIQPLRPMPVGDNI